MDICDGDLVRQARAGDAAAFRLLVERYSPSARARAARLCGRADDVDDIVQEAVLQAFMALDRLRGPGPVRRLAGRHHPQRASCGGQAGAVDAAGPAGTQQVTAPPGSALALAAALEVPVRVPDTLMDRLAIPVTGDDLLTPFVTRTLARPSGPRSAPRNLAFADGLDGWIIGGSSRAEVTGAHWNDYTVAAANGTATLSAPVPQPYGDVFLGQEWLADDYHGATVTLRAEVRSQDVGGHPELSLDIVSQAEGHNQDRVMHAPHGDQPQPVQRVRRDRQHLSEAITGTRDWTRYQITGRVPADAEHIGFELALVGPGSAWLRNVELARTS